jgi:hypothetical protein
MSTPDAPVGMDERQTMVIRCTGKVLSLLGVSKSALVERERSNDDWYAHLVWIEGRKCLLITHAGTLFSVFVPNIRAGDVSQLGPFLTCHVERELREEGLPADTFWSSGSSVPQFAKTADRSVVGCMNDMAFLCEHSVAMENGLNSCDVAGINHRLRRHIVGTRAFTHPIDATRALVDGWTGD